MKLLVLGASGFVGANVARALAATGHEVVAGTRGLGEARRRLPGLDWVETDFARLRTAEAWAPLLAGVEAVVNCVGVLQDSARESTRIAHETGPAALIAACEAAGVRRFIHLSAAGADESAGTAYARSKRATERLLEASGLDWVVLRPSLVIAREVYGGTALMRGLAGFPLVVPVLGGEQRFRPVAAEDVGALVARLLEPGAPSREAIDVAGPKEVSLASMLIRLRAWLGFRRASVLPVPAWMSWPLVKAGDLAAWLGWPSSLRTTSVRQMNHGASGDPARLAALLPRAQGLTDWLAAHPAGVQDRWHARLYFVKPLAILVFAAYWIATGLIGLAAARPAAIALLHDAGFGEASPLLSDLGHIYDLALGALLLVPRFTRAVALVMAASCVFYLAIGTALAPALWHDPLQPLLKVFPVILVALVIAALVDRR
ncbi:MAG: SDR family oxidoreductase [Sphingomonadaceae bacterium]|nr:SDR family oxidoreductase [Sphingomonadaceae bacterium]